MTGPISMPPTTTVANGRCTWLPIPEDSLPGRVVHGGNRFHAALLPDLIVIGDPIG